MLGRARAICICCLALILAFSLASPLLADVTGNFGLQTHLFPDGDPVSEFSVFAFDIEAELNLTAVISGLSTTFHTHFGIAGVEDVIITSHATLGALDMDTLLLFGRFPCGCFLFPAFPELQFFGLQASATLTLGGVQITNLAIVQNGEGLFAGNPVPDDVFGDVIRLEGQTPSGVNIFAEAGFCMFPEDVDIKKHDAVFEYSANFICSVLFTGDEKPDILFDFEEVLIEGIPLAPGVTTDVGIFCDYLQIIIFDGGCTIDTFLTIAGGPVPIFVELELLRFSDPFDPLSLLFFNGATLVLQSGSGTLYIDFDEDGTLEDIDLLLVLVLNPDTLPATLALDILVVPGIGVVDADILLEIVRAGLTFEVTIDFDPGGAGFAVFDTVQFEVKTSYSIFDIELEAEFDQFGLLEGEFEFFVNF